MRWDEPKLRTEVDNLNRPRICVCGNLLGRTSGYVTTQGQILADLLASEGYDVISTSSKIHRIPRLVDILLTVLSNRRSIDVLILEVYSGLAFVLADCVSLLCKTLNIPTIFVLHGGNLPTFAQRHPAWLKRVLSRACARVAPSSFLKEELGTYGFPIRVIPNVVAGAGERISVEKESSPILLWMRSFHSIYNPQMALDAFAAIKRDFPNAKLVMAGADKGLEAQVQASARGMGLGDSVRFPGFLDEKAKRYAMSVADIYLNTNRVDNVPVSVIEACAMGLPVIATNVGGLSHLISHGENGILVRDGDSGEMAEAVRALLNDADTRDRISRNAQLLAEKFSWSSVKKTWAQLFEEVIVSSEARTGSSSAVEGEVHG